MANTRHLGLPMLAAAQAQKHVTHNEAIHRLDALVMLAVFDRDLASPPASPAEGDRYLVAAPGSGAFAGKSGQVAHFIDGGWSFFPPEIGWTCWVADESLLLAWNGIAWQPALGGGGGGGSGAGRERLTADRIYYVRADGSDSNSGLTNTAGGAFATLQKAYDTITGTLDLGGRAVTIQIADGTYAPASGIPVLNVSQPWTGGGSVTITGNVTTPANVVLQSTAASVVSITAILLSPLTIQGVRFTSIMSGTALMHGGVGVVHVGAVEFGVVAGYSAHVMASGSGAVVKHIAPYTISGGAAAAHWWAQNGGTIACVSRTVTLTGAPAIGIFAYASRAAVIEAYANTYVGSATGTRHAVDSLSLIFTNGAGASALPGSIGGTAATGGQYV